MSPCLERLADGLLAQLPPALGAFSADGATIDSRWETSPDGRAWELDFELTYRRLDAPVSWR